MESGKIPLRDYQEEALQAVVDEFQAGVEKQLVVLPTGSGKTVLMAAIAKRFNKRTLLLAHREELISQGLEKFKLFWPEVDIGICMAERNEIDHHVVVGSVQSCSRPSRLERLKEQNFQVLFVDEAHHSVSSSYRTIIEELGFTSGSGKLAVGLTATPERGDKQGLGDIYDKIVFSRSISTMIAGGFLVPVVGRRIVTNFNLGKISTRNGDFAIEELADAVDTPQRNAFIVNKFKEYAADRKAIAFCVNVEHSINLANAFKAVGIASEAVYGDMNREDRRRVLESFKTGALQVIVSCQILTEGFDEPSVNAILMCRPTKSQSLFIQSIGRGLRLWPAKECCHVLDFTDRMNNLNTVVSLRDTIPDAVHVKDDEEGEREEREKEQRTSKIYSIESIDKEFDILGRTRFIWTPLANKEFSLIDDNRNEIIMMPEGDGYIATVYYQDGLLKQIVKKPLPLPYAQGVAEDFSRKHLKTALADLTSPWMKDRTAATKGQRDLLEKNGVKTENMTKSEASIEIRKVIAFSNQKRRSMSLEPISSKQAYYLRSQGINPAGMSKYDAMTAIGKLKKTALKGG